MFSTSQSQQTQTRMIFLLVFGLFPTALSYLRCEHRCNDPSGETDGGCRVVLASSDYPPGRDASEHLTGRCLENGECQGTPHICPDCNTILPNCRGKSTKCISTFPLLFRDPGKFFFNKIHTYFQQLNCRSKLKSIKW